jgi:hypothetical protein
VEDPGCVAARYGDPDLSGAISGTDGTIVEARNLFTSYPP